MEHPATPDELAILSQMDFIVPLKQFGLISRAVLEGVYHFYKPRRIILVTSERERHIFHNLVVPYWSVGVIEFVPEETFFLPHLHLTLDQIKAEYDDARGPEQREVGWWLQQLVKLGAASQVEGISEHYVVWDGKSKTPVSNICCHRDHGKGLSMFLFDWLW
ncbi:hypothetical protein EON63_18745 [archaeon]|nr:MAG: hypothetical protein EON63_18745 [archaeon]